MDHQGGIGVTVPLAGDRFWVRVWVREWVNSRSAKIAPLNKGKGKKHGVGKERQEKSLGRRKTTISCGFDERIIDISRLV